MSPEDYRDGLAYLAARARMQHGKPTKDQVLRSAGHVMLDCLRVRERALYAMEQEQRCEPVDNLALLSAVRMAANRIIDFGSILVRWLDLEDDINAALADAGDELPIMADEPH